MRLSRKKFKVGYRNQKTPKADLALLTGIDALAQRTAAVLVELQGDASRARRDMPTVPSLESRVDLIADALPYTTARPTQTQRDSKSGALKVIIRP